MPSTEVEAQASYARDKGRTVRSRTESGSPGVDKECWGPFGRLESVADMPVVRVAEVLYTNGVFGPRRAFGRPKKRGGRRRVSTAARSKPVAPESKWRLACQ